LCKVYKARDVINSDFNISSLAVSDNSVDKKSVYVTGKELQMDIETLKENTQKECMSFLDSAKQEAQDILCDAQKKSEKIFIDAKEDAYKQVMADCENLIQKKLDDAQTIANEILDEARKEKEKTLLNMKDDILALSIEIAKKIVNTELENDEKIYQSIVLEAIKKVMNDDVVQVRVAKDFDDEAFKNEHCKNVNVSFVKDKNFNNGDCVITSSSGIIDAGIEAKIDKVKLAFGADY